MRRLRSGSPGTFRATCLGAITTERRGWSRCGPRCRIGRRPSTAHASEQKTKDAPHMRSNPTLELHPDCLISPTLSDLATLAGAMLWPEPAGQGKRYDALRASLAAAQAQEPQPLSINRPSAARIFVDLIEEAAPRRVKGLIAGFVLRKTLASEQADARALMKQIVWELSVRFKEVDSVLTEATIKRSI